MNTDSLAKHYHVFTPAERLPLIQAAAARGDEVERGRLVRSAPRVTYCVPDYFGLAEAFEGVSLFHLLDLLDTAAAYNQAMWFYGTDTASAEQMLDCALMYGYLFQVKLAGWRLFCREHGFEPERYWALLQGYEAIRSAERLAGHAAFQPEGAAAYLKRSGGGKVPPTGEDVAAGLRAAFQERLEWWG
jgi:hypothetical protein